MNIPMQWVMCTAARLIMSKMWLIVYHPIQRMGGNGLPQDTKDRLFVTSLESVEYALLLEREAKAVKWGWFFKTYYQWHALAFLLTELCSRTKGDVVVRAWSAVDATVVAWGGAKTDHKKNNLWKPLRRLTTAARAARDRQLVADRKVAGGSDITSEHSLAWSGMTDATMPREMGVYALPSGMNTMTSESPATVSEGGEELDVRHGGDGLQLPNESVAGTMPSLTSGFQTNSLSFPNAFISDSLAFTEPDELTGLLPQDNNEWLMYGGYENSNNNNNNSTTTTGGEMVAFAQGGSGMDAMLEGGGEDPGLLQWAYFDDMVREFEQENSGVGGGVGGAVGVGVGAGSVGGQWQPRRPLMGDTWL